MAEAANAPIEIEYKYGASVVQMACLLAYCWVLVAWAYSEYLFRSSQRPASPPDPEGIPLKTLEAAENGHSDNTVTMVTVANADSPSKPPLAAAPEYNPLRAALVRCLWLDADALLLCRGALRASAECGSWVLWFYVADRTRGVEPGHKQYVRDQFAFLFIALTAVAAGYSAKPGRAAVALNRTQTEEWKGWMQVLFLLYHYFEAREVYNAIRVFIAAYVWMTGYGNFSYYYRTADFSLGRFCQMMWRLNFLVAVCCAALGNSYMLYYICPMHTLFTVFVYGVLALGAAHNRRDAWIWGKFALSLLAVAAVWEYKRVFYLLFSPLGWLLNYDDPARPSGDPMREWFFRSGLDRYVWIHGMLCAFLHPAFERGLAIVEGLGAARRAAARAGLTALALAALSAWYVNVYSLPKLEYNRLHPYTSWIPITCFIVLRNMTPRMRTVSLGLYSWLGCITLETYIGQFHTWLLTKRPDGQPTMLLVLLPGYPLCNFALVTALYVFVSHRLFLVTNVLKDALVPHDDNRMLVRNALLGGASVAGVVAIAFAARGVNLWG